MNLAFSTRGWRDDDWKKQVEDACEMQFRGIEVYNLHRIPSLTEAGYRVAAERSIDKIGQQLKEVYESLYR